MLRVRTARQQRKHDNYLKVREARFAAGLTSNGTPPVIKPALTMLQRIQSSADRFWSYVDRTSDCWNWLGTRTNHGLGYGKFSVGVSTMLAHRVSYIISRGEEIPHGRLVCHRCDNPCCVNPSHLWLGTPLSNMQDKVSKNRQSEGARHATLCAGTFKVQHGAATGHAKICDSDVIELRKIRRAGLSLAKTGKMFGISAQTVLDIMQGKTWKHVPEIEGTNDQTPKNV